MLRDENDGKQKNRRILCGRKDSSMQSENLSGNTNQAVFKHSFLCMHLDFPLFPNSPCTDLQPGENRQHHILWLISPCHGKCSMPSEACQEFWTQPVPGMPTGIALPPLRSETTLHVARGFVRNKLSNNQKRSIRRSDTPLLMQVYKRNALVQCA